VSRKLLTSSLPLRFRRRERIPSSPIGLLEPDSG
jgi:hypothetical protein